MKLKSLSATEDPDICLKTIDLFLISLSVKDLSEQYYTAINTNYFIKALYHSAHCLDLDLNGLLTRRNF